MCMQCVFLKCISGAAGHVRQVVEAGRGLDRAWDFPRRLSKLRGGH